MRYKILLSLGILMSLCGRINAQQTTGISRTSGGLEYKIIVDKPGDNHPKVGDYVTMHLTSAIGDSIIYNSRELNNNEPVTFQLMKPGYKGDLTEGIMEMTPGDSALIYISVDDLIKSGAPKLAYMKEGVNQKLVYRTVLIDVKPKAQMKKEKAAQQQMQSEIDDKKLQEYFSKNNIKPFKTASGLYYTIDREQHGAKLKKGDKVSVNYTGKTLNGNVFDSNVDPSFMHKEPFTFILGMGHVIKGWDEGVSLLKKGTKATLYIPSGLAYGPNSPDPRKIPDNAIMVFDIEVLHSRQDSLRGNNGLGRKWWDVLKYNLTISFDTANRSIIGHNTISFKVVANNPFGKMQVDMQEPMIIDSVIYNNKKLPVKREGNAWWIETKYIGLTIYKEYNLTVYYHGKPREAKLAPWDGGFIWTADSKGNPWYAVACQGLGASSWWPCKDYQGDEPDNGMQVQILHNKGLKYISNGTNLYDEKCNGDACVSIWRVTNPINTYNTTFYIGDYVNWTDTLHGENGILNLSYYALRQNKKKATKQFAVTKDMLHCFEYWMGPYPFYKDGYKLVEAPFLGMEHQSAIAYGNGYQMGYLGMDRSGTGVGKLFDFIIIHESGHEWFGNNITGKDIADNWLHEGFTTYTEALFIECAYGKKKAFEYTVGQWKNIKNDRPVIGTYDVHDDGSGDKYDKGSAIVHMIRVMINDDLKFRDLLRGLNKDFYHQTVTTTQIEDYIINFTGFKLEPFFEQYLRTTQIPELEWYIKDKQLHYRFVNVVTGFKLPLMVQGRNREEYITVTADWQAIPWKKGGYNISFSKDFLIQTKP